MVVVTAVVVLGGVLDGLGIVVEGFGAVVTGRVGKGAVPGSAVDGTTLSPGDAVGDGRLGSVSPVVGVISTVGGGETTLWRLSASSAAITPPSTASPTTKTAMTNQPRPLLVTRGEAHCSWLQRTTRQRRRR